MTTIDTSTPITADMIDREALLRRFWRPANHVPAHTSSGGFFNWCQVHGFDHRSLEARATWFSMNRAEQAEWENAA